MRTKNTGTRIAALLLAFAAVGRAEAPAAGGDDATRAAMGAIVDSLAFVLPLSLADERFSDPAQRQAILAALDALVASGAALESHGQGRDAGFAFLSRSLARDTREIRDRFAAGRPAEARFLLLEVTDHCSACHSRLPDGRDHPVGRRLVDDPRVAALDRDERVNLEVATRQFERALASYEALFADPARSPADLDLEGHVDGYLEVVLRVQNDPDRALRTFTALSQRKDLPAPLRENLGIWIASLRALRGRSFPGSPLASARALMAEAQDLSRFPDDRAALVDYVAASSLLHRFIATRRSLGPEVGEACYLLGVIESRIGRSFWLSQTEFFLEQAIRLAPQKPFAKDAFELLEEFLVSGYTGSVGSEVPPEVRARLDELRGLIRRAQGA
jgi:hypothetical protein